jgi:Fic family protein
MSGFLDDIDRLQKTLQDLQPLKPEDQERLDKKFRLEFNYNSNHIEGNTLTYGETKLLLLFDDVKGNHTLREYEEMKSHDVAYKLIEEWAADTERPLSEQKIKKLNEILLVRPYWKEAITADGQPTRREIKVGDYKEYPNSVRLENGEIFHYASPIDTPIKMQELIDWYRSEEGNIHPVTLAAMLHYKFVSIHPFDDGNGRISRLLVNYVLIRNGLPPVVIKSSDKANYLRALHLADVGDYEPFIEYISEQAIWSLETSIKAARGEKIEEYNDIDKEISVLKKELKTNYLLNSEASPLLILDVIEHDFISICKILQDKCSEFNDLFFTTKNKITYTISGSSQQRQIGNNDVDNWDTFIDIWIKSIKSDKIDIAQINFLLTFNGLKTSISGYTLNLSLNFYFNRYNYMITIEENQSNPFIKPYGENLTTDESHEIVSSAIKKLIERIKSVSKI